MTTPDKLSVDFEFVNQTQANPYIQWCLKNNKRIRVVDALGREADLIAFVGGFYPKRVIALPIELDNNATPLSTFPTDPALVGADIETLTQACSAWLSTPGRRYFIGVLPNETNEDEDLTREKSRKNLAYAIATLVGGGYLTEVE